jgi:flagellar hook-associated protein 3 FlgL
MIRRLDPTDERFLASLERIDARLARAERELSSGRRLATPSDSPDEVSRVLVLRAALEATGQTRLNLARVKTEVDTAERSLARAVEALDRAVQLGLQGATETQSPAQRDTIAVEVRAVLEQLVNLASTAVEGRYVFSGDRDRTAPYTIDYGQPAGVSVYQGAPATREISHPAGTRFTVARTAQQVFDAPAGSAFAGVNALRTALESGPAEGDPNYAALYAAQTAAIATAIDAVGSARSHVSDELAVYGTAQARVKEALDAAHELETRQKAELSALEDADITAAILELNTAQLQRESALSARARRPQGSLFDYLKF